MRSIAKTISSQVIWLLPMISLLALGGTYLHKNAALQAKMLALIEERDVISTLKTTTPQLNVKFHATLTEQANADRLASGLLERMTQRVTEIGLTPGNFSMGKTETLNGRSVLSIAADANGSLTQCHRLLQALGNFPEPIRVRKLLMTKDTVTGSIRMSITLNVLAGWQEGKP